MNILILGGTAEARVLAARLVAFGHDVTTSLAGVTSSPLLPEGKVRVGGFGGVDGLAHELTASRVDVLIDATHPFAAQMSTHAHVAAKQLDLPLFRLERPQWARQTGDLWTEVDTMADAGAALPAGARVMVTTGRKNLEGLFARDDLTGLIRVVEPLQGELPARWQQVLDRPPYQPDQEQALFATCGISHLLTKNAGGDSTSAKLVAARALGLRVIMLRRPAKPSCPTFPSVDELVAQLGTGDVGG